MNASPPAPIRNPWSVVLSCFLGLLFCISPFFQYSSGVILAPMAREFGWSHGQFAMAPALASLTVALLAPFVGWWIDRRGARIVALTGSIAMPLAIMSFGLIPADFRIFILVAVLVGIFGAATLPSVYLYSLPKFFDRRLGLAISLGVIGLGVGQIVMPQLSAAVVGSYGWRGAWIVMGGIILLAGVANAALLVPRRNAAPVSAGAEAAPLDGMLFGEVLRTPGYWMLALAFFLIAMVTNGTAVHLVGVLETRGLSPQQTVIALSAIGIGSITARLASGVLIDWFGVRFPAILFLGGQALGCVLLGLNFGSATAILGVMLIGGGLGAESDIMPYVLRRKFGMRAFGRVNSFSFSALAMGSTIGPTAVGFSADWTGGYSTVLLGFAVAAVVAIALICLLAPPHLRTRGPRPDTASPMAVHPANN
ncbi:MFS transporter [Sphingobium amiense]|uniref:MFS transporter n=1 Tax=Sphingobium amiense TaxID=135719 RepID=A0A494WFQ2_9SPHN|nr:MFS transporter [Sphingobium amiense]BBD99870.1 MFS transporter [Sphingobium amiense]